MSGAFTPDSLSREGSPVPEDDMGQQHAMAVPSSVTHKSQAMLPPVATDLRTSQSAPGSPSAQILQGNFGFLMALCIAYIVKTNGRFCLCS